ncbi:NPCC-domain-containing protein [Whalleya microplaca]|nr:NPCC-domain-containing protein [Whalleya microplaca]
MSSSTAQVALSTPKKTPTTPATPVVDSPGNWKHPRLQEITRRQSKNNFTEKNIKHIAIDIAVFLAVLGIHSLLASFLPPKRSFPYYVWQYTRYFYWTALVIPVIDGFFQCLPLMRAKDDMSDIPLTPGQRRLLGLPPSSAPPTPGSVYSTPPRYSRTPSISGSAGSKRSFSISPASNRSGASNYGSPAAGNGGSGGFNALASPGSPLLQKAMNGARRSSFGSLGTPTPLGGGLGASLGASTGSFFGSVGPDTPSPSSANGKRSTVGLNSKWLYERGRDRRSSGNAWLYA